MMEEIIEVVKEEIIEVAKHIRQERVHGRTVEHAVDVQVLRILWEDKVATKLSSVMLRSLLVLLLFRWRTQTTPGLNGFRYFLTETMLAWSPSGNHCDVLQFPDWSSLTVSEHSAC